MSVCQKPDGTYFARNASKAVYEDERNIVLRVTGILRMYPDTATSFLSNGVAYPKALTDEILRVNGESAIVKEQLEYGLTKDVITGQPFKDETTSTGTITAEYRFQSRLIDIGGQKSASEILIYPKTFESKDQIKLYLDAYNEGREEKILYSTVPKRFPKPSGAWFPPSLWSWLLFWRFALCFFHHDWHHHIYLGNRKNQRNRFVKEPRRQEERYLPVFIAETFNRICGGVDGHVPCLYRLLPDQQNYRKGNRSC